MSENENMKKGEELESELLEAESEYEADIAEEADDITATDTEDITEDDISAEPEEKSNETKNSDKKDSAKKKSDKTTEKKQGGKKSFSRKTKHGIISAAISLLVVAAIVLLNIISVVLTSKYSGLTADITSLKSFELSDESVKIAENVSKKVSILFMTDKNTYIEMDPYCKQTAFVAEALSKYSDGLIEVNYIDLVRSPTYADKFADTSLNTTDVVIECGDYRRVLTAAELYNFEAYSDSYQYITSSSAEQVIDNAIVTVTSDDVTNVVIITDYCSADYSYLKNTLSANGYNVTEMSLVKESIPRDTDMVIIYAPTRDYSEEDVSELKSFLENDGKYGKSLLYAADSMDADTPHLNVLLLEYGLSIEHALAFEMDTTKIVSGSTNYYDGILCSFFTDLYTENMTDNDYPVVTGYTRPVYIEGINSTPLLVLSEKSGECPYDADEETWNMEEAVTGKECVLAQGTNGNDYAVSTVIVSGSYNLFAKAYYGSSYGNSTYLSTMLADVNGRTMSNISVAEKVITDYDLNLDRSTAFNLGFVVYAFIPIVILGAGFVVFLLRRNR